MNRKDKMISFRMSDDEYRTLKALCAANGTRNVSELARIAIQKLMDRGEGDPGDRHLRRALQEFDGRLTLLDHEVARLARMLEASHSGD